MAILLSAILSFSACVPAGSMTVFAAENDGVIVEEDLAEDPSPTDNEQDGTGSYGDQEAIELDDGSPSGFAEEGYEETDSQTGADSIAEDDDSESAQGVTEESDGPKSDAGISEEEAAYDGSAANDSETGNTDLIQENDEEEENQNETIPGVVDENTGGGQDSQTGGNSDGTDLSPVPEKGGETVTGEKQKSEEDFEAGRNSAEEHENEFDTAQELHDGDSIEVQTTDSEGEHPYAFFKFTNDSEEEVEFCVYSESNTDTYAELFEEENTIEEGTSYRIITTDDDSGDGSNFKIIYKCEPGKTCYLRAHEYIFNPASFSVHLRKIILKVEGNEYQDINVVPGDGVTLSVKAQSKDEISYQWYVGAEYDEGKQLLEGETSDSCTFVPSWPDGPDRYYSCRIQAGEETVWRTFCLKKMAFTVKAQVNGSEHSDNDIDIWDTVYIGDQFELNVNAQYYDEAVQLSYLWEKWVEGEDGSEWVAVPGATGSSFTAEPHEAGSSVSVLCKVRAEGTEDEITVTFQLWTQYPYIWAYPSENGGPEYTSREYQVGRGSDVELTVATVYSNGKSTEGAELSYSWYCDDQEMEGDNNGPSIALSNVTTYHHVYCEVTDIISGNRSIADFYVNLDPFLSAEEIDIPGSAKGVFSEDSENTFYTFSPSESGVYRFFINADFCLQGTVYDSDRNSIASISFEPEYIDPDDSEYGNAIECYLEKDEKYYFQAYRWDSLEEAAFTLSAEKDDDSFFVQRIGSEYRSIEPGENIELRVVAQSTLPVTYEWYVDDEKQEESSDTFVYSGIRNAYIYCVVSDRIRSGSASFNIRVAGYWSCNSAGDYTYTVEKGASQELKVVTAVDKGYEGVYNWSYRWIDQNGNTLGDSEDSDSYTAVNNNGLQVFGCEVSDQFGNIRYTEFTLREAGWLPVWPGEARCSDREHTYRFEKYTYQELWVNNDYYTDLFFTWYDEAGKEIKGRSSENYLGLENVSEKASYRCHVDTGTGDGSLQADLWFHVRINSYLTVYPEGNDEWESYKDIDLMSVGTGPCTLRTIAENSEGCGLTYQWRKLDSETEEWIDIAGADSEEYVVEKPVHDDRYQCHVEDEDGNSSDAEFHFYADEWVDVWHGSSSDMDAEDYQESGADLQVEIYNESGVSLVYEWAVRRGDGEYETIPDADDLTYHVDSPENGTSYRFTATSTFGKVYRLEFRFLKDNHLVVYTDNESEKTEAEIDFRSGDEFVLTPCVIADDMDGITYQWKKDWENIEETSPSIVVTRPSLHETYQCTVTDRFGNAASVDYYFRALTNLQAWPKDKGRDYSLIYYAVGGLDDIALTAVVEAEEGTVISWSWERFNEDYYEYEEIKGQSGTSDGTEYPLEISLDVASPEDRDAYRLYVRDEYGNTKEVFFNLLEEVPELNVWPDGAEEGEDTTEISFNSGADEIWMRVNAGGSTDLYDLSYDWRDPEGNGVANEGYCAYIYSPFEDGAIYTCTVTDQYGQSKTLNFVLHYQRQEGDPTEEDLSNAVDISVGQSADVEVTEEAPVAWYRFEPDESGEYELASESDSCDTYAVLYNSSGMRLNYDDDGGINGNFSLIYDFEKGKTYYFAVRLYGYDPGRFTIRLYNAKKDEWLNSYYFKVVEDRIVLTGYKGYDTEITVPGHAMARGQDYDRVELSAWMWPASTTSLSFEEGVAFPENSSGLFAGISSLTSVDFSNVDLTNVKNISRMFSGCRSLEAVDLSSLDFSNVEEGQDMFDGCSRLQTIKAPTGLTAEVPLYRKYYDESGNGYTALPTGLEESITLTRAPESAWLADYDYEINDNVIVLRGYYGDESEIVVPGSAVIDGVEYSKVSFGGNIWPSGITSIKFEEGVVFPEECSWFFERRENLTTVDMAAIDASGIRYCYGMFDNCPNLMTICAPTGLTVSATIPAPFISEDGTLYTSLPQGLEKSITLERAEISEWLRDYDFTVTDGVITLERYKGRHEDDDYDDYDDYDDDEDDDDGDDSGVDDKSILEVPGSALIGGNEYGIRIKSGLWNNYNAGWIRKISLGEGVIFPEDCSDLFIVDGLQEIDMGGVDVSEIVTAEEMFGKGVNLQKICAPKGLSADIQLPAGFVDGNGTVYFSLPKELNESLVLTRAETGEELSDYSYTVIADRVRLLSYFGEEEQVTVPGTVTIAGTQYNTVELTPGMWDEKCGKIRSLAFDEGVVVPADCEGLFRNMSELTELDIKGLDWSQVTNMSRMFDYCCSLHEIDLSGMNTANVTNMSSMFADCYGLERIDLSGFDTHNVTDMRHMFSGCNAVTNINMSGWNTQNVTDMSEMFYWCENLETLNLRNWKTGNVENMSGMFHGCESLSNLMISGIDTTNVTDMSNMFRNCRSLATLDLSSFVTPALVNVRSMFRECSELETLNISGFDSTSIEHVSYMFKGCSKISTIYSPAAFTKTVALPAVYEGTNGGLYGTIPRNLTESIVLVYARDLQPGESGDPAPASSISDAKITLSPEEFTYTGEECRPDVRVVYEGTELTQGSDYTVSYRNNTEAGEATVTVTGKGSLGGIATAGFVIHRASIAGADITVEEPEGGYVFSGSENRPSVTVTFGGHELATETDFTVGYTDNINAGEARVTVSGKGNFKDEKEETFVIAKAPQDLTAQDLALSYMQNEKINVTGNMGALSYKSADTSIAEVDSAGFVTAKGVGETQVTVISGGTYNYTESSTQITVRVTKASQEIEAENLEIALPNTETLTVNGAKTELSFESLDPEIATVDEEGNITAVRPGSTQINVVATETDLYTAGRAQARVKVRKGEQDISVEDIEIEYPESRQLIVTGVQGELSYEILDESIATVDEEGNVTAVKPGSTRINVTATATDLYNAGEAQAEVRVVKGRQDIKADDLEIIYLDTAAIGAEAEEGAALSYVSSNEGIVTVDSDGNVTAHAVGEAKITITAGETELYRETVKTIDVSVASASVGNAVLTIEPSSFTYDGTAKTPEVTVTFGDRRLTPEKDYTLIYSNNVDAGTATAVISGTGNYTGTASKDFAIGRAEQSIDAQVSVDKIAVGRKAKITVTGAQGEVAYTCEGDNGNIVSVSRTGEITAKKVGNATITVTAQMAKNYKKAVAKVTVSVVPAATSSLTTENTAAGVKLSWNAVSGAQGYLVYRGSAVIATLNKGTTVSFTDKNAKTNGSKYMFKVIAFAYTGNSTLQKSVTTYFVSAPSVSQVTESTEETGSVVKKMLVKWSQNVKATGYELVYSKNTDFTDAQSVTITDGTATSREIPDVDPDTVYYVRIRAAMRSNGTTYYSAYSTYKSVMISK